MPKSTTKRSTPKLSDLARHVVAPKGVVSTGWPAVQSKCLELGIRFRSWQPDVGRLILAKRADGKYAATIGGTGLSIPRQVGKTFLVGAIVFALCLLRRNLTVIWTAHRLRTAEETFGKMQAFAKRKRIAPHVRKVILGSGDEAILFRNGSRILFGARERGFGRGFDEVDVLIFDEAQILTENALDDMIPATNQSRQDASALLLFMGTPPKPTDPGEVFTRMRSEALTGEDEDTGWIEFGADEDYEPTPLPAPFTEADWRQVAKANPSYPDDTPREAILRMRKKLGADSMRREGFGIWDEEGAGAFSAGSWRACRDDRVDANTGLAVSQIDGMPSLAVDVSPDHTSASLAVAGLRADGLRHVEVLSPDRDRPGIKLRGTAWVVPRVKQVMQSARAAGVRVDPGSAAGSLIPALRDAGIPVIEVTAREYTQGCGALYDAVEHSTLRHLGQPDLDAAVGAARPKPVGDTAWKWARRDITEDITPLVAVTLALTGVGEGGAVSAFSFSDLEGCESCGAEIEREVPDDEDDDTRYLCQSCLDRREEQV